MNTLELTHSYEIQRRQPNAPFEFARDWMTYRKANESLSETVESLRFYRNDPYAKKDGEEFRIVQIIHQKIALEA